MVFSFLLSVQNIHFCCVLWADFSFVLSGVDHFQVSVFQKFGEWYIVTLCFFIAGWNYPGYVNFSSHGTIFSAVCSAVEALGFEQQLHSYQEPDNNYLTATMPSFKLNNWNILVSYFIQFPKSHITTNVFNHNLAKSVLYALWHL